VQTRRQELFSTVRAEGAILPADVLRRVADGDRQLAGLSPQSYRLDPGETFGEAINRSWNRLVGAWPGFRAATAALPEGDPATTATRERWLLLLFDALGYGRLPTARAVEIDGRSYPVSHAWGEVPIHLVGCRVDLDRRTGGVAGAARTSPHSLLQELLNASEERLWGLLSNGLRLRLLRDNAALTRQAYVEFDLEAMMEGEVYSDFALLWLVADQSRLEPLEGRPEDCWLERWSRTAAQEGTRALEQLRRGVEAAIAALGHGFLAHPANRELRLALREGRLSTQDYYRQLLRLVYRLLFVAEDRDLLAPPATDPAARARYADHYSTARLRRLAQRRRGGRHGDLWRGLGVVATVLGRDEGAPGLALPALGGLLFSDAATPHLDVCELANRDLLSAVRELAFVEDERALRAVDYRNLGSEELGSVYESLLELQPELSLDAPSFALAAVAGSERKTTGSYYTPTALISCLLDSALDPVLEEAAKSPDPEAAILALKVCDPACGSGHFLIAAAHRIAKRLAAERTGEQEPTPESVRSALRDVIGHCVYGVDINPMAVELCKVALWMEALEPGKPLSFLDAHVRVGNALLGALPGLVLAGVRDAAFAAVRGDDFGVLQAEDKSWVTKLRKRNADERTRGRDALTLFDPDAVMADLAVRVGALERLADDDVGGLHAKESSYAELRGSDELRRLALAADAWAAAPLAEKRQGRPAITQRAVDQALAGALPQELAGAIAELRGDYRLFHWHLEFPDVFARGGFDLVIGNPPWDTLSPDVKEFFAAYDPQVRFQDRDGQRKIVRELLESPEIAQEWRRSCRALYASVHAFKNGGRYHLFAPGNLGKGDFNVYRMFAETALAITRPGGYTAQVVPENLANGANAAAIRTELLERRDLVRLITFENRREIWFKDIDSRTVFCVYSARRAPARARFDAAFDVRDADALRDAEQRPLSIPKALVREFSPDALAVMRFSSQAEIDAVSKAYARCPRFGDAAAGEPYRSYMAEIHMGNDRHLFSEDPGGLPLYEGRMVWQFDHRAKGYRSGRGRAAVWEPLAFGNPSKAIQPQWRIPLSAVPVKARDRVGRYRVGFCDVASPTNERSLVAALIPPNAISSDTVPTFVYGLGLEWAYMAWLACANSFVVDFIIRKKVSLHVKYSILDTVPFPRNAAHDAVARALVPVAARLTCTGPEMLDYWALLARDGWVEPGLPGTIPGEIDDERRIELRAEIDAIVAADVYGLDRAEFEFVLSGFPLAARYENERWGEFRSGRLALEAFDRMAPHGGRLSKQPRADAAPITSPTT
jgi:hypothetical protein